MNLKQVIEAGHSKIQCLKVVTYIGSDPGKFKELINVFLKGPYRVTQRAAWPLTVCVENHPELARPHFSVLISMLTRPNQHDAVRRNILRLFQFVSLPERYHGKLLNLYFNFLTTRTEPLAVKVFSMVIIHKIVKSTGSPEIAKELKIILEDELQLASAGYRSRASKILRDINQEFRTTIT
jgi:hypothetical protein